MTSLPPRPANTAFGIRIDGAVKNIGFNDLAEAERAAHGHAIQGRNVEIFDKVTGKIIKRMPTS